MVKWLNGSIELSIEELLNTASEANRMTIEDMYD
jgi:hypothetical protein